MCVCVIYRHKFWKLGQQPQIQVNFTIPYCSNTDSLSAKIALQTFDYTVQPGKIREHVRNAKIQQHGI